MSFEQFSNNASTTLGSSLTSGATTATVSTGTGALFPTLGPNEYFTATLWAAGSTTGVPNEIVKVTAISGDTMTIVRGQEGTTAQAWSVGDTFANYPTAGFLNRINNPGLQSTGQANLTVSQTLTQAQAGANLLAVGAITITFPDGIVLTYSLNNTGTDTVDLVFGLGTDFKNTLLPGEKVILASDGNTPAFWRVVAEGGVVGPPSGAAGGDLAGSYPDPTIALNAVTNAKLAQAPAGTMKCNLSGAPADVADEDLADVANALFPGLNPMIWAENQQGSGGSSTEALSANAWHQRLLNTAVFNTIAGASLSGSQITLPAGTYTVSAHTGAQTSTTGAAFNLKARLRDATHGATLVSGVNSWVNSTSVSQGGVAALEGIFTLGATSAIELDSWSDGSSLNGGLPTSSGELEIYSTVVIRKIG